MIQSTKQQGHILMLNKESYAFLDALNVFVAQQADVCLRPSLERGQLAATFTRTFFKKSRRFGVLLSELYLFDEKDPAMLTLPLYWEGNRVFEKASVLVEWTEFNGHYHLSLWGCGCSHPTNCSVTGEIHRRMGFQKTNSKI